MDTNTLKKVLIVDDEEELRLVLRIRLRSRGFEVVEAGDGLEAYDMALKEDVSAVILDLMMPTMNGYETWRKFKAHPKLKDIPIIILTCKRKSEDVFWGETMSKEDFFTKPYDTEKLIARITTVIERQHHHDEMMHHHKSP